MIPTSLAGMRDIRKTAAYARAESHARQWFRPGTGGIVDALDLTLSPDRSLLAFSGVTMAELHGAARSHICVLDLRARQMQVLTDGPYTDRLPQWSPDGRSIFFLSDRDRQGVFQLHCLDLHTGIVIRVSSLPGSVEGFQCSPRGTSILMGVAGQQADAAGIHGGFLAKRAAQEECDWLPEIEAADGFRI